jgi:hypothetical protein
MNAYESRPLFIERPKGKQCMLQQTVSCESQGVYNGQNLHPAWGPGKLWPDCTCARVHARCRLRILVNP